MTSLKLTKVTEARSGAVATSPRYFTTSAFALRLQECDWKLTAAILDDGALRISSSRSIRHLAASSPPVVPLARSCTHHHHYTTITMLRRFSSAILSTRRAHLSGSSLVAPLSTAAAGASLTIPGISADVRHVRSFLLSLASVSLASFASVSLASRLLLHCVAFALV